LGQRLRHRRRQVDGEHRELLVGINELSHCLAEGRKWSKIVGISKRLRDKCFAHFRDERAVLQTPRYGKLAAHERQHRYIEQQLDDVLDCIGSVTRPSRAEVEGVLFLRSMLIHHFFRYDLAYKSHLQRVRIKGSRPRSRKAR
jgi:hemerythrin-like metal-binding protein